MITFSDNSAFISSVSRSRSIITAAAKALATTLIATSLISCSSSSNTSNNSHSAPSGQTYSTYIPKAASQSPAHFAPIAPKKTDYTVVDAVTPRAPYVQPIQKPTTPTYTSSRGGQKTKDALGHKPGPKNFRTVIIDAGHGGRDSGATVQGTMEKTLALDIALRLQKKLAGSFKTVLIRKNDTFVSLDGRVDFTHRYDDAVLVSIHLNQVSSTSVRGPETYYFRVDSYSLAKRMQRAMAAVSPSENSRGLVRRRLRLTRNPQIPSVLVEIGYLSNYSERTLMNQPSYRDRMASALAQALLDQKKYGDAGMGKLPAPLNRPLSRPTDSSQL